MHLKHYRANIKILLHLTFSLFLTPGLEHVANRCIVKKENKHDVYITLLIECNKVQHNN